MTHAKVLVVEDFDDIRSMIRFQLRDAGYEVVEARDGYEAVEKAVETKPDLILMDIAMPVMDGIQATAAIRQHDDLADVPIIAVTAYGDFYEDRALDVGYDEVIQKPLDVTQLRPLVQRYLARQLLTKTRAARG
jgi:CheY-like chemotaxis protein